MQKQSGFSATNLSDVQKVTLLFAALVLFSLPLALFASSFETRTLPKATGPSSMPAFPCKQGLTAFTVSDTCERNGEQLKYKSFSYTCADGSKGDYFGKSCRSYDQLKAAAQKNCRELSEPVCPTSPTPTPPPHYPTITIVPVTPFPTRFQTPTPRLSLTPVPSFCGPCPQFMTPPNFCTNGTIINQPPNACGCPMPPICQTTSITPTPSPQVSAQIDPQTSEMYDLQIESQPTTVTRTTSGPLYVASTVFNVGGTRITNLTSLYGFLQNPSLPFEDANVTFALQQSVYPRFISSPVNLIYNGCVDLHKTSARTRESYVATFCYKVTFVEPNSLQKLAYSPSANPMVKFDYVGTKVTTVEFITTAFDKYLNNAPTFDGINKKGSRVNYLSIDTSSGSLSSFRNVVYTIQGLIGGLSDQEVQNWCMVGPTRPTKYLKQTYNPKPEGGNNFPATLSSGPGGCAFDISSSYLLPFYLSLYK